VFIDESGALKLADDGHVSMLATNFECNDSMTQSYILDRNGTQYIIWANFSSDRSTIAMPIDKTESPGFSRLIHFVRDVGASTEQKRDVRIGSDFSLPTTVPLLNLSCEKILDVLGNQEDLIKGEPKRSTMRVIAPGYSQTIVDTYGAHGKYAGTKYYIDRENGTWSIHDTTCLQRCGHESLLESGVYVGAIGNLPITLQLRILKPSITGSYRYHSEKASGSIDLRGSIDESGRITLHELSQSDDSKVLATFSAEVIEGVWRGTWKATNDGRSLDFFATPSSL
jgi:hypothetical protein